MCFYLDYNIGSLSIPNLLSWCLVKFDRIYFFQVLLKFWPIIGFQLDQFLHECSIFVVVIGSIRPPCNRDVAALSNIAPHNSPSFQEGNIPLVFNLDYFFFFLVNSARSCVSRMILLAVCTCNFFQVIFLHVVRVRFTAFGTWLLCGVHIFGIWSTSGELGRTAQLSQDNSWSSPRWEYGAY